MKIICSKEKLMDGINIVQKAVSVKTTLPILEGILFEATDKLKLTGNDLEIGIECIIDADVKGEGSVVLNSKLLGEIVRKMPDSEVLIEMMENNVVIMECENSHFEINGITSSGYPAIPAIDSEEFFEIGQKITKDMIRQTIFAVGVDENRPILTGSLIECSNGELAVVSIDGNRMALRKKRIEGEVKDFSMVVPGKTLNEISKILQPVEGNIKIYSSNNQIMFCIGNCKVVSRLIEGKYVNYTRIIPEDCETKIKVNKKEMLAGIERASLMISEERVHPVRMTINEEKIIVTANTEAGKSRDEIRVKMTGKDIEEVKFNPRFLIDALRAIDDENIEIQFASDILPCTIRPVEGNEYVYLIAPLRK